MNEKAEKAGAAKPPSGCIFGGFRYISYLVGSTLLFFVIGNLLLGTALSLYDRVRHGRSSAPDEAETSREQRYGRHLAKLPPLRDYAWAEACADEHVVSLPARYAPFKVWRRKRLDGEHINVNEQGVRQTAGSDTATSRKRVFLFGGSTMWGSWVSDAYTIPSLMQARSETYSFINYGETGYGSVHELNELLEQLARGNVPDVVVFYDGYNDCYAGVYSPGVPRSHQNLDTITQKFEGSTEPEKVSLAKFLFTYLHEETAYGKVLKRLSDRRRGQAEARYGDVLVKPFISERVTATLDMYEATIRQVKALGREYGFRCVFVWQPNLLQGTRKMLPHETKLFEAESTVLRDVMASCYGEAKQRLSGREEESIHFIGNILDETEAPMYVDPCHIGPEGNRIVAEKLLELLP